MTFSLAFVDSVTASPVTRLDLMGSDWRTLVEGTDFGMPPMKRAVAGTMMTDGEVIPASAYGNRVITLHLDASHLTPDAAATALQALFRELDRPNNFLRYTPDTTQAITFLTFRTSADAVVWDAVSQEATVRIPAQPSGYGDKRTETPVAVTNNPAAGSNGMFFDVEDVLGDVETPLFLSIDIGDVEHNPGRTSVVSVRRRGDPDNVPFLIQAESMSMGTDTTVQANSALMSGAGSNYTRTTFATSTAMVVRLGATHPAAATADARGTYRVFLRYRKSVSGDTINVRLKMGGIIGETHTLLASTQLHWKDMGLWQLPLGGAPTDDGYSGQALSVAGTAISVQAERPSGSGNLDIDALVFMPADDRLAVISWPYDDVSSASARIVDPAASQIYAVNAGGAVTAAQLVPFAGGLPYVGPGVTNRVYFLLDAGESFAVDDITAVTDITPYYWPRYLFVRPVAS